MKTRKATERGCGESMRVQSSDNCPDLKHHDMTMDEKWAKPQHTPGPWKVMRIRQSNFITREVGRSDLQIHYEHIATIPQGWLMPEKQKDANARLIAAAPELLEALKLALTALKRVRNYAQIDDSGLEEMAEAIAKAEGR